jgi:peptidyl-prolyl cis-trans isomerase A (cyclophilin A)
MTKIVWVMLGAAVLCGGCPAQNRETPTEQAAPSQSEQQPAEKAAPQPASDQAEQQAALNPSPNPAQADGAAVESDQPAKAPSLYTVKLETTKGEVLIDVHRDWAPLGADRFHELVKAGYYDNVAFFRVLKGFMAQTGLNGDPMVTARWREKNISDDPVKQSNSRGLVSFATAGPNTRTTQFFINYSDNSRLDGMGFSPFGKVQNMRAVDALYSDYGEGAPRGRGPSQGRLTREGNAYLKQAFPQLDYITKAEIVETPAKKRR